MRLATFDQAAAHKGCSNATIRSLVASGELAVFRVKGKRTPWVDLDELDRIAVRPYARYGPNARVVSLDPAAPARAAQ